MGIERLHLEQDAGKSIHDHGSRTATYVDLNRSGVALMEIVSQTGYALSRRRRGLRQNASNPGPLSWHLRRRHGEGQLAGRRERLGAQAGRVARHALRDQERQLHALHPAGHRLRGAPAGGGAGGRRPPSRRRRACSTPARAKRAPCAPRRRRTTTATSPTRTCCRWKLDPEWIKAIEATLPELPDAKRERMQSQYGLSAYDAKVLAGDPVARRLLRGGPLTAATPNWSPTGR